jgi:hypothetical protein
MGAVDDWEIIGFSISLVKTRLIIILFCVVKESDILDICEGVLSKGT